MRGEQSPRRPRGHECAAPSPPPPAKQWPNNPKPAAFRHRQARPRIGSTGSLSAAVADVPAGLCKARRPSEAIRVRGPSREVGRDPEHGRAASTICSLAVASSGRCGCLSAGVTHHHRPVDVVVRLIGDAPLVHKDEGARYRLFGVGIGGGHVDQSDLAPGIVENPLDEASVAASGVREVWGSRRGRAVDGCSA